MWFVAIGGVLLVGKLAGWGPLAEWSWWAVLAPFALAALWWGIADSTGWTKRRAAARDQERVEERRRRNIENLGLGSGPPKKPRG